MPSVPVSRVSVWRVAVAVAVSVVVVVALPLTTLAGHFSDVPDTHPFHDEIAWLAANGITTGFGDGTFRPNDPVARMAMAAFMRRLAGHDPNVAPMVNAAHAQNATNATNATNAQVAASVSAGAVQTVSSQNAVVNAVHNFHTVTCPAGTVVVGGGGLSNVSNLWVIEDSRPIGETQWSVRYTKRDGVAGNQTSTVFARCLTVS